MTFERRRTQVAKGAVCKTAIQRFDPARRLHLLVECWFLGLKNFKRKEGS